MRLEESLSADIELYEAKGDRAQLGIHNKATLSVHFDLVFFEFELPEVVFVQSSGTATVGVKRLNNRRKKMELEYHTTSSLITSEWKDVIDKITFGPNQEIAKIEMEFDQTPMTSDKDRITIDLLADEANKQRLGPIQQSVLNVSYDVQPTKIDFVEPVVVASKSMGKVELPVTCVAKSRSEKSNIAVSWHSDGLRKEQKGQVHFKGLQVDAAIVVELERIKATEFEVYIQEVKGAPYVSITQPKCKVKVVDDCPTYSFQHARFEAKQSEGDVLLHLTSPISAAGRKIFWSSESVLPKSPFQLTGETLIEPERTCAIKIKMPEKVMPITMEEFKVTIGLEQNKGLVAEKGTTCTCIVRYDIRPGVVAFKAEAVTVQRKEADSISLTVVRENSVKGEVVMVYEIDDKEYALTIADGESEGIIELPIEQVPMKEAQTIIRARLKSIHGDDVPVELGDKREITVTINNDVPLPVFEFKSLSSKIVQSLEKIEIPVMRTAGATTTNTFINWRVSSAPTESKLLRSQRQTVLRKGPAGEVN